jgi:hypothetical protein
MMGRLKSDQGQLFYEFHLGDAIPEDHLVRKIDAALDLSGEGATDCRCPFVPSLAKVICVRWTRGKPCEH